MQKIPTIGQVNDIKKKQEKKKILDVIESKQYIDTKIIDELIEEGVDVKDIAKALITLNQNFDNLGKEEKEAKSINLDNMQSNNGMIEVFITAGKMDNIKVKDIVGSIAANTGISGSNIGRVNLLEKYSFAEIPKEYIEDVILGMKNKQIKGKDVNIEIANKTSKKAK